MKLNPRMLGLHAWNCDDEWSLAVRGLGVSDAVMQGWDVDGPYVRESKRLDLFVLDTMEPEYRRLVHEYDVRCRDVVDMARKGWPAPMIEQRIKMVMAAQPA